MGLFANIGHAFLDGLTPPAPVQTRSATGNEVLDATIAALRRRGTGGPWRVASVDEALGVPAIFGAVSLIAGTMGTLTMDAFLKGTKVAPEDRPRLVVRPNPLSTPYRFFYLSAFYKATRGEQWWWVASRDADGIAESLYPVPPWEVKVTADERNRLRPKIEWGTEVMRNEDMIQDIWFPSSDGLRGLGPLQKAGAAVSVAVESQEWAANFFAGSTPTFIGHTDQDMTEDELAALDKQWNEKAPNTPRWLTNGLTLEESPIDPQKFQLDETRQTNVGDVARMFGIPGSLLEYQMGGSSLTYQNQQSIWSDFQNRCLNPYFAKPMEHNLSDLLTRSWTVKFDFDHLLRADIKTRFDSYKTAIEAGFLTTDEARISEGLAPGESEYAPVPAAPPAATPTFIPVTRSAGREVRCPAGHLLAELASPPYKFTCFRCHREVAA